MSFNIKENYTFDDLLRIMEILRSPDGCMWDKAQTHLSIRQNLIEETYEVCEGIDKNDSAILKEELGDLLLQVVFHSQMAKEENEFDINDVCNGICKKLIDRHPHIFGDVKVNSASEILDNWEKIKQKEKGQMTASETVNAVPKTLPALMRSEKVQKRAAKAGFDYTDLQMSMDVLDGEISELKEAIKNNDKANQEEELGDVIFSAVNVARFLKVDSELSLTKSCEKFMKRFEKVDKIARERNIDMKKCDMDELNNLWHLAKTADF